MLFVLPFIVMAITFLNGFFRRDVVASVKLQGVIDIAWIDRLEPLWQSVIGFVVVLGLAYLIFFINEKFRLLSQTSTLPSLIYVLLTSGLMVNLGFDYLLIAVFIVALAAERLQTAIKYPQTNTPLFDFGALIMLAVAVYPKFVLLILWALCVLFFSGRSTLKDIMALLLGLVTPVIFVVFYYFWVDRLALLPGIFSRHLLAGRYLHTLPAIEIARLGMLSFLLLLSLYHLAVRYSLLVVSQRRGILSLVSMLVFLTVTLFIVPGNDYGFMYMISLPLAFIYAQYFLTQRIVIFGNLMFGLLLTACFLSYLL